MVQEKLRAFYIRRNNTTCFCILPLHTWLLRCDKEGFRSWEDHHIEPTPHSNKLRPLCMGDKLFAILKIWDIAMRRDERLSKPFTWLDPVYATLSTAWEPNGSLMLNGFMQSCNLPLNWNIQLTIVNESLNYSPYVKHDWAAINRCSADVPLQSTTLPMHPPHTLCT